MSSIPLEPSGVSFHLVPLPKGVKGSRAAGFLGDEPAGTYAKSGNKNFLCTAKGVIALAAAERGAAVGPGALYPGTVWTGKQNTPQAAVWTMAGKGASGCALATAAFTSSHAAAVDGQEIVGTGEGPGDAPSRALYWKGGGEPILLADPQDADAGTAAYAIGAGCQGGSRGGMNPGACFWRGNSASYVSLHPAGVAASRVRGVSDAEQVGEFEPKVDTGAPKRAALWRGTAASFVDLTPEGVANAVACAVGGGFQAGWVEEAPRSQRYRAWLWAGSAKGSLDLHPAVGGAWTASTVSHLRVVGKTLLLLGTVEQRQPDGYKMLLAEQACWWEYPL